MFYYLKEKNLLQGYPCCVTTEQLEKVENYKEQFGDDVYEYEGDYLPVRVFLENDIVVIPSQNKLKELDGDNYILPENFYYDVNSNILEKPFIPEEMLKPKFIEELEQWIETATQQEIEQHEKSFKNERLKQLEEEIAIASVKLEKGLITQQDYDNLLIEFNILDLEINPL